MTEREKSTGRGRAKEQVTISTPDHMDFGVWTYNLQTIGLRCYAWGQGHFNAHDYKIIITPPLLASWGTTSFLPVSQQNGWHVSCWIMSEDCYKLQTDHMMFINVMDLFFRRLRRRRLVLVFLSCLESVKSQHEKNQIIQISFYLCPRLRKWALQVTTRAGLVFYLHPWDGLFSCLMCAVFNI